MSAPDCACVSQEENDPLPHGRTPPPPPKRQPACTTAQPCRWSPAKCPRNLAFKNPLVSHEKPEPKSRPALLSHWGPTWTRTGHSPKTGQRTPRTPRPAAGLPLLDGVAVFGQAAVAPPPSTASVKLASAPARAAGRSVAVHRAGHQHSIKQA